MCMTERSATIELSGGELDIVWDEDDHVYMTGPASEVFSGVVSVGEGDAEE
jgi:diaminopimelate epimerase